jgi:hypothetical protein
MAHHFLGLHKQAHTLQIRRCPLLFAAASVAKNSVVLRADILVESLRGDPKLVCEFMHIAKFLAVLVVGIAFFLEPILNGIREKITMLSFPPVDVCLLQCRQRVFTIRGEVSTFTIRGKSGVAIALVLAAIMPFFFLFFDCRPPLFFGWMNAKNRLIPCAPTYAFADAASNGFLRGAIVNEEIRF